MDDATINALVAERVLRGLPWAHNRDYCNDPAAWGALLVWLAQARLTTPRLPCGVFLGTRPDFECDELVWEANLGSLDDEDDNSAYDAKPGRALALAALKAYGVEVEE